MAIVENEFAFWELRDDNGFVLAVSTHREPLERELRVRESEDRKC